MEQIRTFKKGKPNKRLKNPAIHLYKKYTHNYNIALEKKICIQLFYKFINILILLNIYFWKILAY